ncbi:MAG: hypothetical protein AB1467_03670 [Candidatus Diapherotrites archaeon]
MDYKQIIIAAIIFTVIGYIIHILGAMASMSYYLDPNYFAVWSKIMMPAAGPPPAEFTYYSIAFGFIAALLYAIVYSEIKKAVPGKDATEKGLNYGLILFLVAAIPSSLSMILLINLPAMLVVEWAIESLIIFLLGGMTIAKIVK